MSHKLIQHAREYVWMSPQQDYQHIFDLARISYPQGVRFSVNVEWYDIPLPDSRERFHVFSMGQLSPVYLDLCAHNNVWYSLQSLINNHDLIADMYLNDGRQIPRFDVYLMRLRTRQMIVAVQERRASPSLRNVSVYLRFYTNAYYKSERYASTTNETTATDGIVVTDRKSVVVLQNTFEKHLNKVGYTYAFHNGHLVDKFHPDKTVPGDVLEYVYDPAIYQVVDFPVKDLKTFASDKDTLSKYLIGRFKGLGNQVDYIDDIDVWLYNPQSVGFEGIYFHKNQPYAVRQVSHRDYSIAVKNVVGFTNEYDHWLDSQALVVRLHIRKSGYQRTLNFEHRRIYDLYRLDNEHIHRAMVGAESSLVHWKAKTLENSDYTRLMGVSAGDLDQRLVQQAYGYNAATKVMADTPLRVENLSGTWGVVLPVGLMDDSTVFEYDKDGLLLDWHYHESGKYYYRVSEDCEWLEVKLGKGSQYIESIFGPCEKPYTSLYNYRFYINTKPFEERGDGEWKDVTDKKGYYWDVVDDNIGWLGVLEDNATLMRSDETFLCYRFYPYVVNGVIQFTITANERLGNGDVVSGPLVIPYSNLVVFLNGHSLIENLDYFVQWPEVVIVNKEFLSEELVQDVVVRCDGFCRSDLTREPPSEFGFVTHGILSRNDRFDVRDDKVMRMVVEGRLWDRSELKFSDTAHGVYMDNVRNGAPYVLEDPIIPLRDLVDIDVYDYRDQSKVIDKQVSDYLTRYYPEPVIDGPSIIPRYYNVYSPFLSAIHYDLKAGTLNPEGMSGQYSDRDLKSWLRVYERFLPYDPVIQGYDARYVVVHPHTSSSVSYLNIYQYNLLRRAVKVYLDDKVDLTHSVKVIERWI